MNHLAIMAKAPEAGRVKTRLARAVGGAEAVRVYRSILEATLRRLAPDPRWTTWVAATPDRAALSPIWPRAVSSVGQGPGDLGDRMQRLFDRLPSGPVIVIGSDIPGISPTDIAAGFRLLGGRDAIVGPAPDGGYWLVGQSRRRRVLRMFDGVRWSGPHAMEDTLANLTDADVGLTTEKSDVDTVRDYRIWRAA